MAIVARAHVPRHGPIGRLRVRAGFQVRIAQLDAHQLTAVSQQLIRFDFPRQLVRGDIGKGLQGLQVVGQRGANVGDGVCRVALQVGLHLAGLITPCQPHQGHQHGDHQKHQRGPQRPPPPCTAPALDQRAFGASGVHSTRCVRAGNCVRTSCRCCALSSPITTPAPSSCCASTWPHGSTSMLWPQVRRPFSWWPPCAGAIT